MLVFSYSPAGLGHLRVTEALYDGMPKGITPVLLGSQDKGITTIHRLVSLHPLFRSFFEWAQSRGGQEYFFTYFYRLSLRTGTKLLYQQIVTLLEQRIERPKTLLIVATHFGLAHQIAILKDKIGKEQKIKVVLAVIVTDDSPQFIWYVEGADLIFVPSSYTKRKLEKYGKTVKLKKTEIVVNPYPVSPILDRKLSLSRWNERLLQLDPVEKTKVHIVFPVSGAAIGMTFFVKLVDLLYRGCPRFVFHVVAKTSLYTLPYLNELMSRPYVKMHLANLDRDVVNLYEEVYQKHNLALEITKPSEQAFKSLISTDRIGGSILLFAEPVGRQEIDNLNFLVKHELIPNLTEQKYLWSLAERKTSVSVLKGNTELWKKINNWRGLVLPHHSLKSARFINWSFNTGLLKKMAKSQNLASLNKDLKNEVSGEGVNLFWNKISEYLQKNRLH